MKVLHVATWKTRCGIASCTESLVEKLDFLGVENQVYGISPYDIQSMLDEDVTALTRDIRRQAETCDLVHVQHEFGFFGSNYLRSLRNFGRLLAALRRSGRPVVVTFHTEPNFPLALPTSKQAVKESILNRLWWWYVARQFRGRKGCHGLVHTAKGRQILVRSGFGKRNAWTIPMGHELRTLCLDAEHKRQAKLRLGIGPKSVLLSIFGFISSYKGHRIAVEALKCLPKKYVLAVIGGRHPSAGTDSTINQMLLAWRDQDPKRLIITGYADRATIDLYQAATDVCLAPYLPIFNLSASAALTWAITSGRPTIASAIPAFEDIRRRGDCLLTVTPGAACELAWMIESLASNAELQARLVQNAQSFAQANSWDAAAKRSLSIYEAILSNRNNGRRANLAKFEPASANNSMSLSEFRETPDIKFKLAG
jgi:glycosyltransferase involved in cell wall biosynthesis